MSSSVSSRQRLALRQSELVGALIANAPSPAGFDQRRVDAAVDSLRQKRLRSIAKAWPELEQSLGGRYLSLLLQYAGETPLPRSGGAMTDGRAFVAWLTRRGALPDETSLNLAILAFDIRYCANVDGLRRRRHPMLKFRWLRRPLRLAIAARWPTGIERIWLTPFPIFSAPDRG